MANRKIDRGWSEMTPEKMVVAITGTSIAHVDIDMNCFK